MATGAVGAPRAPGAPPAARAGAAGLAAGGAAGAPLAGRNSACMACIRAIQPASLSKSGTRGASSTAERIACHLRCSDCAVASRIIPAERVRIFRKFE